MNAMLASGVLTIGTLGGLIIGVLSGLVGLLVLLKKQNLPCIAISYAGLPGIVLAFIITGTYSHMAFITGAIMGGCLAAAYVLFLLKNGRTSCDSSLALMLIVYFGLGMVLLTMVQQQPGSAQAGIDSFLFGEAATMLVIDVKMTAVLAAIALILLLLFGKELLLVAFDSMYAESIGYPVFKLEIIFLLILVLTIAAGLQAVGIVLMGALLISPAVAARQWTSNIRLMLVFSMFFGGLSGVAGSIISGLAPQLPTGATIVAISSGLAFLSFFFAPTRGYVWSYLRQKRQQANNLDDMLRILYQLSCQHKDTHGHPEKIFQSFYPLKRNLGAELDLLRTEGLIAETEPCHWAITDEGIKRIEGNSLKPLEGVWGRRRV